MTKNKILDFLGTGRSLTAKTAANRFGVEPHTVRSQISKLKAEGYVISTSYRRYNGREIAVYSGFSY